MRHAFRLAAPVLALGLLAAPALAQDMPEAPEVEEDDGLSLMEEGARLFMQGIMSEMEPALRELEGWAQEMEPSLRSFAAEMGPALRDLFAEVEDWSVYEAPEVLSNGDIIIRRKEPLPEDDPLRDIEPGEEIEL